jgi:hypothetical protein
MSIGPVVPEVPSSGVPRRSRLDASSAVRVVAVLVGCGLVGLLGGLIWGEFAPRALLEEIGTGTAEVINAETRAFIGADIWFSAIAVLAGLLTGVLGYRFALSGRGDGARAVLATALLVGAVAGTFVMLWLGERIGLSGYDQQLASSPSGTKFSASLGLGAKSALAIWPMFTAIVILVAEWGTRAAPDPDPGLE